MPIRCLAAFAAALSLALSVSAQPAERLGIYGIVGSATPERSLFPDAADPILVVGYRLAPGLDVHLGARIGTTERITATRAGGPFPGPGEIDRQEVVDRTRAVAGGLGVGGDAGPLRLRMSASISLDAFERTVTIERVPAAPLPPTGPRPRETASKTATFAHAGLSATVSVPLADGRIAPGLGLAASMGGMVEGDIAAPPARWMPFVSVPVTVRLPVADITLDARTGVARGAGLRGGRSSWAPVVEAGVRIEI